MTPIDFTRRTAVYRLFDLAGHLLYVGVAFDPERRWKEHASVKPWWTDVARKDVVWYDTRTDALNVEAEAIKTELPLYNVRDSNAFHPTGPRPHGTPRLPARGWKERRFRSDEDWSAYAKACEAKGISRSDDVRMHIKREVSVWRRQQRTESD